MSKAPSKSDRAAALATLQKTLGELKIGAYIIPTADAHQSEYVAEDDKVCVLFGKRNCSQT
jgi:hypothetical protein